MRRHSVTGPLFLVGIGLLFLVHNFSPGISVPRLLSQYWPYALILVGIAGLTEVLFHASRGSAIPPRPISGLVWLVVVFSALGLWSYRNQGFRIGRLEAGSVSLLGTDYQYDVNASTGAEGINRVIFENLKGNLIIKGGDAANVLVSGHRTIRAYSRNDADQANASGIRLERQGNVLLVHDGANPGGRNLSSSADLDITVPRGVSLETRDRVGDLSIDDIQGSVDVSNGRGEIRLNNIEQDVKVDTRRSSLIRVSNLKGKLELLGSGDQVQVENIAGQVTVNGKYLGTLDFRALAKPLQLESDRTDMRADAVPGSIELTLGNVKMKNVTGPVRFQRRSSDVEMEDVTNSVEVVIDRGDIQVSQATTVPRMDVHTRHGDITLAFPEKAIFDLKASTAQGEIENDFGSALTTETTGRSSTARGFAGAVPGKGPTVSAVTDRGTVSIKKN